MNTNKRPRALDVNALQHPLIRRLVEMAAAAGGRGLLLVYPTETGWGQTCASGGEGRPPEFCKAIQSTVEGVKHCKMCHILMTVAACGGGPVDQRCHAGSIVMVAPVANDNSEALAILSSCIFADKKGWEEAQARGKKLGLDLTKLHESYLKLPRLGDEQRIAVRRIMEAISSSIELIRRNKELEIRVQEAGQTPRQPAMDLRRFLETTDWARLAKSGGGNRDAQAPLMIRVVCELIRQRPDLPLTVKELAAAARLTPNHFTTSFHHYTGQTFTGYLLDQRIARAKKLLSDLTLNIGEIARLVGYDDAGYFARRFRKATRLSPRTWRNRHSMDRSTGK